ncbi:MAG: DNA recombination protein RmuC [Bacteroidota bacterium]|nr:DNA recombination protein RmuC [Bacteroidota bacterium]
MIESVFLILGLSSGAILTWVIAKSIYASKFHQLEELEQKATLLEVTERALNDITKDKSFEEKRVIEQQRLVLKLELEIKEEREKNTKLESKIAKAEEIFKNQNEKIATQKEEMESLTKKLQADFENIASRLLEEKSQKFTEQNRTNLDIILNPLKDRIKEFEEKVDKTYKAESGERISLKTEIKQLMEMNLNLQKEANNLTTALKGDNKKQGNWGEIILERVLEMSGLQKDREYRTQYTATGNDGNTLRPDVVVMLPDNKHIIIDSKVSLIAYDSWSSAETEQDRSKYIKQHVDSVRNHIKQLGDKNYQAAQGFNSPDMVLLFMPIEPAFAAAMQHDQDIYTFAWERKIVIVSPSTLLATLRTVSSLWQQDRQVKNALEIARQGGELYDKFVGFVESLEKVGKSIDVAHINYNEAYKKLSTGSGNLVNRTQKLQELGAKTTKQLSANLLKEESEEI